MTRLERARVQTDRLVAAVAAEPGRTAATLRHVLNETRGHGDNLITAKVVLALLTRLTRQGRVRREGWPFRYHLPDERLVGLNPQKYDVHRVDGSTRPGRKHHGCRYFVLDLRHDLFAGPALRAYADACAAGYPALAQDVRALTIHHTAPQPTCPGTLVHGEFDACPVHDAHPSRATPEVPCKTTP